MNEFGIIDTNVWQQSPVKTETKTYINTERPQVMHLIKSGWEMPQMYNVVIEDGEHGYPTFEFLSSEQIKNKFNIKL